MSLFKKTPIGLPRSDFRAALKKAYDPKIKLNAKERVNIEKEAFPKKYGPGISEKDLAGGIKGLRKERSLAKHTEEKLKIDRQIRLLEKLKEM